MPGTRGALGTSQLSWSLSNILHRGGLGALGALEAQREEQGMGTGSPRHVCLERVTGLSFGCSVGCPDPRCLLTLHPA